LLDRGAWVIATTHYTELKAFAHDTEGLTNASVEFNADTLAPTYRLLIGLPGKSNALSIALRLGLDPDVVADARQMVDTGQLEMENLVAGLQADRQNAESILANAESDRQEARRLRTELEQRLRLVEDERREIIRRSRREAESELADLRARLREAALTLQRQDRSHGELAAVAQAIETAGRQVFAKPLPGAPPVELPTIPGPPRGGVLAVGDVVRITSLNQEGRVGAILNDGANLEVQLGNFKLRAAKDDVEWLGRPRSDATAGIDYTVPTMWNTDQRAIPDLQLDMRGWRAEQVVPELERYLNDAYMSGLPTVRLVHGKGTGVLRQVVRDYLAKTRLVDRFEIADAREGGEGATVAHIAL
jgi:DNA mismatch repair protein MutS2